MKLLRILLITSVVLAWAGEAHAFCGFYVAGADAKLLNNATTVVMMRDGKRTVLSIQNNYEGPPEHFAMVVPVPVVLQKEDVKTLDREIFDRVDALAAPRLVEYWEQDPCMDPGMVGLINTGAGGIGRGGMGFGSGAGAEAKVKIEAQFEVGEYEIVILSASDSTALDQWLRDSGYRIPAGAEEHLRPYVARGMKFFVAKVNPDEVRFDAGMATLSPLRFHYDSDDFSLPVRLGLINSGGKQDLVVHILARNKRYQVANYPNVVMATNLAVKDRTRDDFGSFYAALFDETLGPKGDAVATEYAWAAKGCDPCPTQPLSDQELLTLGADVMPTIDTSDASPTPAAPSIPVRVRLGKTSTGGDGLPKEVVARILRANFGRFRMCYQHALKRDGELETEVTLRGTIVTSGNLKKPEATSKNAPASMLRCLETSLSVLTFPVPRGGATTFEMVGLSFAPDDGADAKRRPGLGVIAPPPMMSPSGFGSDFVLTRLHARYGKDSLGADLVFEEAPPIEGGRERFENGELEKGSKPGTVNNFQARYIIRHPWTGPVECEEPVRGRWGGPPDEAGGDAPRPRTSGNAAFAKRDVELDGFLEKPLEPPTRGGAKALEPPPAAPSAAPKAKSDCACDVAGARGGHGAGWLALLGLTWVCRWRRRDAMAFPAHGPVGEAIVGEHPGGRGARPAAAGHARRLRTTDPCYLRDPVVPTHPRFSACTFHAPPVYRPSVPLGPRDRVP